MIAAAPENLQEVIKSVNFVDEYGNPGDEVWVSFALSLEEDEVLARAYIETSKPGKGNGTLCQTILTGLLQNAATAIGYPIRHRDINLNKNPAMERIFQKFGYECIGTNEYGQKIYERTYYSSQEI
jgi:hypothetical protein